MPIDEVSFEALMELFKTGVPGWQDFSHEGFNEDEVEYKRHASAEAQRLLSRKEMQRLLQADDAGEILQRFEQVGKSTNLLWNNVPTQGDLAILFVDQLDKVALADSLFDLLHGTGDSTERLGRFVEFVRQQGLPSKWTFPTYFLFLLRPETDFFVKPSITGWLLSQVDEASLGHVSSDSYARVVGIARDLRRYLEPFGVRDMIDVQSFVWQCATESSKQLISPQRLEEFRGLYAEFLAEYVRADAGQQHISLYAAVRESARVGIAQLKEADEKDLTDLTLLKLLPYQDTESNRARGAWISHAPAIAGDVHTKFEGAGWAREDEWPIIADTLRRFVFGALEDPDNLPELCTEFASSPYTKGFQAGTISPILNAIDPDCFAVINTKPLAVVSHLTGRHLDSRIETYAETNRVAREAAEMLEDEMQSSVLAGLSPLDVLDMFSHWMVAVRHFDFHEAQSWKIAPGENANLWKEWLEGGYASIGWEEMGDVSSLSRAEFNERRDKLVQEYDDWHVAGVNQVWRFARQLREGDFLVANQGKTKVLAIGTVIGEYYFVPNVEHGHRIPVDWSDLGERSVSEPGWQKTLIKLGHEKLRRIQQASVTHEPDSEYSSELEPPLSAAFRTAAEATKAISVLRDVCRILDVTGADDERIAITLPVTGKGVLRLNYLNCLVLSFEKRVSDEIRILIALDGSQDIAGATPTGDEPFLQLEEGSGDVALYYTSLSTFLSSGETEWPAFRKAIQYFERRFEDWQKSPFRDRAHSAQICQAVFSDEYREELLSGRIELAGGQRFTPIAPVAGCPFSQETFELLAGLRDDPTKAFYDEHRERFRQSLEEPFRQILKQVGRDLPEPMRDALETEKRITSHVPKNDFGRGGAHSHYWGAFYPKGSRRIADAQLFLWMDEDVLGFGFYIGEYASEQRARFLLNASNHRELILETIGQQLTELELRYGPRVGGADGRDVKQFDNLRSWLDGVDAESMNVERRLTQSEVLALTAPELSAMIRTTFEGLYPLFMLAVLDDPVAAIAEYLGERETPEIKEKYELTQCSLDTGFDADELARWVRAIERKKQAIIYGPPGTGKTYMAEKLGRHLIGGSDGFVELVQFHPAYAYEDFMQGIRPRTSRDGRLEYPMRRGRFLEFCDQARGCEGRCVMIIDEINRANLARVFGELMYLLEYRDQEVPLAGGGRFAIPGNVRLIGTMNTADRSIALVDHALRRRFAFLALHPNYELLRRFHASTGFDATGLVQVLQDVNTQIADPHYEVGITFFLRDSLEVHIEDVWRMEVEPYLEEYFFDQPDKTRQFRWQQISGRILRE